MRLFKLVLVILFINILFAQKIDRYEVFAKLNSNGTLNITEQIYYNFENLQRHGIYRDIPTQIKVDGKIKNLRVKIISVLQDDKETNWQKEVIFKQNLGKFIRIKIGSKDKLVTNLHKYTIKYKIYNAILPYSKNKEFDALRLNIIGTLWDEPIYNIYAKIELPLNIANYIKDITTYSGKFGSTTSKAKVRVYNEVIEVSLDKLKPHEGLTVEIAFSKGLIKSSFFSNIANYWYILFLPIALFFIKKTYTENGGFRDKRAVAVMYEPPKELSVLQAGLILDTKADNKDFAAAIVELAQKGYIKIKEDNGSYTLIKLNKNQNSLTKDQKYLLNNILFPNGETKLTLKRSEELAKRLSQGFETINKELYNWAVEDGYFKELPHKTKSKFLIKSLLFLSPLIIYALYFIIQNYGIEMLLILIFPVVFGAVGVGMLVNQKSIFQKFIALIFIGFGFLPLLNILNYDLNSLIELIVSPVGAAIASIFIVFYYAKNIGNFTQKGTYTQKHLLGLKEFIKRVKEDEIKRRLKEDPLYLEKLLPYAMLFGATSYWLDIFTRLNVSAPIWYEGNLEGLDSFDSSLSSASSYATSSNSSDGFGGGGGFSGGGVGGGGGGSW